MPDSVESQLLQLNQRLLDSILQADWNSYQQLCHPSLTAFEPEARGQLVEGLAFHKYYFDLGAGQGPRLATMASPHVRVMGDVAVLSYVRLNQKLSAAGEPVTSSVEETRVWQKIHGAWRHVHFHRSAL